MKNMIMLFALLTHGLSGFSQIQDPVKISYGVKKLKDKTYEVHLLATIEKGWHVYAQVQKKRAVCSPTKIVFAKNLNVIIFGTTRELGQKITNEFKEMHITNLQYEDKVDFVQVIHLKNNLPTTLMGNITYQACNEQRCLPDNTIAFSIPIVK